MALFLKFYGPLKRFVEQSEISVPFPNAKSIRQIIAEIGIPDEQFFYTMVLVNNRRVQLDYMPQDGDKIEVFQPVGGG